MQQYVNIRLIEADESFKHSRVGEAQRNPPTVRLFCLNTTGYTFKVRPTFLR